MGLNYHLSRRYDLYVRNGIEVLYNQIHDLQNNGKITIHTDIRDLLKAGGIKTRFNLKHQNKLLTPTLKEVANQPFNDPDITIWTGDKSNIYIVLNKTDYKKNLKISSMTEQIF